ncbi:hypothetical protein CMUS01_09594 [Colletotrichum musicola]|uniref:Uncharacterized protein n=1 Tax=Colletotrichum musicola TaxID=2175873 RepID=A0A8H6K807_9PEZI|nr:hypothetical protein CMUS01_09594 [Colletotrichum musicola]
MKSHLLKSFLGLTKSPIQASRAAQETRGQCKRHRFKAHAALPADVRGEASKRRDIVGNCLPARDVSDASDASGNCGWILAAMTVRQLLTPSGAEQEGDELVKKRPVDSMYGRSIGVQEGRIETEVLLNLLLNAHTRVREGADAERTRRGGTEGDT